MNHTKLLSLCKTRWLARIDAYEAFQELLIAVIDSLQDIATEAGWNSESSREPTSLLNAVRQFSLIHAFIVVRYGLGFITGIATSLQSRAHDIVCAYNEIVRVVHRIEEVRQCIDDKHVIWFAKAEILSDTIRSDAPAVPRICGRQQNRSNTPATTTAEYFKRTTAISFFDQLLSQMHCRFSNMQRKAVAAMVIVPASLSIIEVVEEEMVTTHGLDILFLTLFAEELCLKGRLHCEISGHCYNSASESRPTGLRISIACLKSWPLYQWPVVNVSCQLACYSG